MLEDMVNVHMQHMYCRLVLDDTKFSMHVPGGLHCKFESREALGSSILWTASKIGLLVDFRNKPVVNSTCFNQESR